MKHVRWWWAASILLATLAVFGPVLFGGRLFSGLYVNLYHYFFFAGQKYLVFELGRFPSWWPAFYSGYPISLTLDGFLNPIFLAVLWKLPVIEAYHWLTVGFFLANVASCYVFARALKLTPAASLLAATAYGFSGIIIRWTDVIVFTALFPILPLSFLACWRIQEGKRGWRWILLFLLAYGWIGGFAELIVYDILALAGWCLYLLLRDAPRPSFVNVVWDGTKKFLLPVLGSVALVSPWLVSIVFFITRFSIRAGGLAANQASSMPIGLSHLIHVFFPRLSVIYGGNLPVLHLENDIDLFIGTVPILLLSVIPFLFRTFGRGWKYFAGLFVFALLMSFPSPLFRLVHHLPVLNWFRWHFKWLFLATFAAALLAGYAFDTLWAFRTHRRAKTVLAMFWAIFAMVFLGSAALLITGPRFSALLVHIGEARYAQTATETGRTLLLTADYYSWIIRQMAHTLVNGLSLAQPLHAWTIACWAVALAALSLTVVQRISLSRLRQTLVAASLLGTTVWSGFLIGFPRDYLTEEPDTASFIKQREKNGRPFRIYDYFPDQSVSRLQDRYRIDLTQHDNRSLLSREMLGENIHIWFGLDAAFDHEPLGIANAVALQNRIFGRDASGALNTMESQIEHFSTTETAMLLGRANVKYVLTPHELGLPWQRVFMSRILSEKLPVYVYENPFFLPRVGWLYESASAESLSILRYKPGELVAQTQTKEDRRFVFRETFVPFWHATVDGLEAPIELADGAFQSVKVPAGNHVVEFRYARFWEQSLQSLLVFIRQ